MHNQNVGEKSDVALREEAILEFWREHDIFNKSLEKEAPNGDYVFTTAHRLRQAYHTTATF